MDPKYVLRSTSGICIAKILLVDDGTLFQSLPNIMALNMSRFDAVIGKPDFSDNVFFVS